MSDVPETDWEAVFVEMEFLFKDYGLPSPYSDHGIEFQHWMESLVPIIKRMHDAENAERKAEASFHRRQLTGLAYRAKARFRRPGNPQPR